MSYARAHECVSLCLSRLRDCVASLRAAHTRAVTAHWRVSAGQSVKTGNRLTAHLTVVRQHMHGRVQVGASTGLSDEGSRIIPSLACGRNSGGSQAEQEGAKCPRVIKLGRVAFDNNEPASNRSGLTFVLVRRGSAATSLLQARRIRARDGVRMKCAREHSSEFGKDFERYSFLLLCCPATPGASLCGNDPGS
jgi:hypothetical protein